MSDVNKAAEEFAERLYASEMEEVSDIARSFLAGAEYERAKSRKLVEGIQDALKSLNWYQNTFQGPDHEFEHFWRVELPYSLELSIQDYRGEK